MEYFSAQVFLLIYFLCEHELCVQFQVWTNNHNDLTIKKKTEISIQWINAIHSTWIMGNLFVIISTLLVDP